MSKWFALVALLAACGDDGPGGVNSTKLEGFWNTEAEFDHTVFAFLDKSQTESMLEPTDPMWPANTDLGAVYISNGGSITGLLLAQTSTYEVKDGELIQTVVGDINTLPGTMYGTQIISYDGETMVLESKNDPSGMRTYTHSDRCASENDVGWRIAGYADAAHDPNFHSPAIAIADDGRVYSLIGHIIDNGPTFPRFNDLGPGCNPFLQVMPAFRQSAMTLRDAEIHTALELQASGADDFKLVHRWKANRTADWQQEDIAPAPTGQPPQNGSPLYSLHLVENQGELIAFASRTNGVLEVYHQRGTGAWSPMALTGASITGQIEEVAIGKNGDIALLTSFDVFRIRAGAVEAIPLPLPVTGPGGVRIDDDGKIHAVWTYQSASNAGFPVGELARYGIYDGAWSTTDLGFMMYPHLLTPRDGKRRVIAGEMKNGNPPLVMFEIAGDDTMTSERISLEPMGGTSPPSFARFVVAEGADGTIATSFNAKFVYAKHPTRGRAPRMIPFTLQLNQPGGHVYSTDGLVDCTQTCTTMLPEGTRLQLKADAPPGKTVSDNTCPWYDAQTMQGYCWHDVVPTASSSPEAIATFNFL